MDDISVTSLAFTVSLGEDKMSPSISISQGSDVVLFKDTSIIGIAVDSD